MLNNSNQVARGCVNKKRPRTIATKWNKQTKNSDEAPKIRLNGTISIGLLANTAPLRGDKRISGKGAGESQEHRNVHAVWITNNSKNNQIQLTEKKKNRSTWNNSVGRDVFGPRGSGEGPGKRWIRWKVGKDAGRMLLEAWMGRRSRIKSYQQLSANNRIL